MTNLASSRPPMLQRLVVNEEYDVIAMRQEIRQIARAVGLDLTQQAKITAAISAIARAILATDGSSVFTIHVDESGARPALQIACEPARTGRNSVADLASMLHFDEARSLVDDASLANLDSGAILTLRMWLGR